jgi:hypothetical protein
MQGPFNRTQYSPLVMACEDEFLVAVANLCSVGVFLVICSEEDVVASLQAAIGCPLVNYF